MASSSAGTAAVHPAPAKLQPMPGVPNSSSNDPQPLTTSVHTITPNGSVSTDEMAAIVEALGSGSASATPKAKADDASALRKRLHVDEAIKMEERHKADAAAANATKAALLKSGKGDNDSRGIMYTATDSGDQVVDVNGMAAAIPNS